MVAPRGQAEGQREGESSLMMEMFWIWMWVMVTWVVFVKIHHAVYLRCVHFVARKLYPSKAQLVCKRKKKPVQLILIIHGSYIL